MPEMNMGDALNEFLSKSKIKKEVQVYRISEVWENIMGKTVAKYTNKIELFKHTLIIYTTIAPLKHELMYQKATIMERVNEVLGAGSVTEIIIK